jgi:hypothetical protein
METRVRRKTVPVLSSREVIRGMSGGGGGEIEAQVLWHEEERKMKMPAKEGQKKAPRW